MNNGDLPIGYIPFVEGEFTAFMDGIKGGRNYGLTKREYFAAMAMQGLIPATIQEGQTSETQAHKAIEMADALLAALEDRE